MKPPLELPEELGEAVAVLAAAEGQSEERVIERLVWRRLRNLARHQPLSSNDSTGDPELHEWRQELL
jgi:hypothetical protein